MKVRKIIPAILAAVLFGSISTSFFSYAANIVPANEVSENNQKAESDEKTLIYRKSVNGKCEGIASETSKWDFTYALMAYNNGQIHIDIQCEKSNMTQCNKIGDLSFDDSMIAAIGEDGYAGVSSFNNHKYTSSKYTTSFSDTGIIYTFIYSDWNASLSGETLMSYDLYVKEKYLNTNQKINFFGTEIEIPFGEPPVDKDAKIAELEDKVSELETNMKDIQNAISRLDANNDGFVDSNDASIILWIYAYNSTSGTPILTMDEYFEMNKE